MRKNIPQPVIAVLSDLLPNWESHASLDSLFMYADAPGDVPIGSKPVKIQEWLRRTNKTETSDPMKVLGRILERYLDDEPEFDLDPNDAAKKARNIKIREALKGANIAYLKGGTILGIDSSQVRSLETEIRKLNIESIDYEFQRALSNADQDPYEAVSAACNILESIFKFILEEQNIPKPKVQDLGGLWKVTKKELGLDSDQVEDQDLLQILSSLSGIISGIAALRTHTSSAHGRGKFRYGLKSRHVLLAIHSAHTLALFVLQTWKDKK